MIVVGRTKLSDFCEKEHGLAESLLKAWLGEAETGLWKTPNDVKKRYPRASILPGNRVVFRLGGNKYRLIVAIDYERGAIAVRWIGDHNAYDRINAETI